MTDNPKQAELVALFNETRAAIREFVESRTDAEKVEHGTSKQWAAKDLLAEKGFQASVMNGGFPAWQDAGLPVEKA